MKIVINKCYGGFGLSDKAYEKMIEYGVPVKRYMKEKRNPKTGLYDLNENGDEEVIYDRELTPKGEDILNDLYWKYKGKSQTQQRYWETWTMSYDNRSNPIVIRVVEELGRRADGWAAKLEVVEIPDGIEWEIDDYDGIETIHEEHRSW